MMNRSKIKQVVGFLLGVCLINIRVNGNQHYYKKISDFIHQIYS